jgi:hypothetical protein
MPELDPITYNQRFLAKLRTDREKTAQDSTDTMALQVHESSFADVIIPVKDPKSIQEVPGTKDDSFYALDYVRPEWTAVDMTLKGEPNGRYVNLEKFATPAAKIETDEYWKFLDELITKPISVKDIFKETCAYPIADSKDARFITLADAAVTASGQLHAPAAADYPTRADVLELCAKIDDAAATMLAAGDTPRRLICTQLLCSSAFLDRFLKGRFDIGEWTITTDGYKATTLLGRRLIVSTKGDLLGNSMYAFADPDYIGKNYRFGGGDVQFFIKEDLDKLVWKAKSLYGISVYNVNAVARYDFTLDT